MKFQLTSHAIDRYIERSGESMTYQQAAARLDAGLDAATRCGKTEKGQHVFALAGTPPMYAVVKMGVGRFDANTKGGVVVTVLSEEQWLSGKRSFDEAMEMLEAYEDLKSRVPKSWEPSRPLAISNVHAKTMELAEMLPHLSKEDSNNMWARLLAVIEAERRRVEHFMSEPESKRADAAEEELRALKERRARDLENMDFERREWQRMRSMLESEVERWKTEAEANKRSVGCMPNEIPIQRGTYEDMVKDVVLKTIADAGSIKAAAKSLGVPRTTINGWLAKWREEDLDPEHERANREAARADEAERRLAEVLASLSRVSEAISALGLKPVTAE